MSFKKSWFVFLASLCFSLLIVFTKNNISIQDKSDVEVFKATSPVVLVPSGQLIGVKLNIDGVFVIGFSDIKSSKFIRQSPALICGVQIGDCIKTINGIKLDSSSQLAECVKKSNGSNIHLKISRKAKIINIKVKPIFSEEDNTYKIGLWVRDSIRGVGTMTFYDPSLQKFGALGHAINDVDTGLLLPIKDGNIYTANVKSIKKSEKGKAGEIIGDITKNDILGSLLDNTSEGIYGNIEKINKKRYNNYSNAIPIALQSEIKLGPAKIMSCIEGSYVKYYDVCIEKLTKQTQADSKGIVLKITDKRLLHETGGIIQGMSGSPIIQNGKLIGAVTHVIVNKPDIGYGIYIEWMVKKIKDIS